jgi:ribose 5-phosphate isomerase A
MTAVSAADRDAQKRAAAERAVVEVEDGMVLGLGSGSTAALVIAALAARVAAGLRVLGIPTSEQSAALARRLGVPLTTFAEHRRIDLTIDGADQVERGTLALVKGLGGALLREKIVASASRRMIVVVDETKLVERLGDRTPLPLEIVPFGAEAVIERLAALEGRPELRRRDGKPFVTDNGNYIVDCHFAVITDPAALEARLAAIVGVVESGLFLGLASKVIVGTRHGVEEIAL